MLISDLKLNKVLNWIHESHHTYINLFMSAVRLKISLLLIQTQPIDYPSTIEAVNTPP